jgi:hypothetical protein
MKIIAVNINRTIGIAPTIFAATSRAWILDPSRASRYQYVIAVHKGEMRDCFCLQAVNADRIEPNRVAFRLTNCTLNERRNIELAIRNENLSRFVTKYIG